MSKAKKKDIRESPLSRAYLLLNVNNPAELFNTYLIEDQKIITSKISDYHDPKLITNKVRSILEKVDARKITKEEQHELRLILWLWYHHAISYAVWGYKDKRRAQKYSSLALKYHPTNHPNKITRLLYLLVRDRFAEANTWAKTIKKENLGRTTAFKLLKFYKKGGFFN